MTDLVLPLKRVYFDEIKSGVKKKEYRLVNKYWSKRLINKNYENIVLTLGYPNKNDSKRRITKPYKGFNIETITHPLFGSKPVRVFAINVS